MPEEVDGPVPANVHAIFGNDSIKSAIPAEEDAYFETNIMGNRVYNSDVLIADYPKEKMVMTYGAGMFNAPTLEPLMKFDISNLNVGEEDNVAVILTASEDPGNRNFELSLGKTSSDWSEDDDTVYLIPYAFSENGEIVRDGEIVSFVFDVTDMVRAARDRMEGQISFIVWCSKDCRIRFYSRETANGPYLICLSQAGAKDEQSPSNEVVYGAASDISSSEGNADIGNPIPSPLDTASINEKSLLGTWYLPGGDVTISEDDMDSMKSYLASNIGYAASKNALAGLSAALSYPNLPPGQLASSDTGITIAPSEVFIYILIKHHQINGVLLPPAEVDSGIRNFSSQYNISDWNQVAMKAFWIDYMNQDFRGDSEFGTKAGILRDWGIYINTRDTKKEEWLYKTQSPMIAAQTQWNEVMIEDRDRSGRFAGMEADLQAKRNAYREELRARGIAAQAEWTLWQAGRS